MEPAIQRVERELERLNLLLHREVMRLRVRYQLSLDEFRGLYISDDQVDELLRGSAPPFDAAELTARAESVRLYNDASGDSPSEWTRIVAEFNLAPVEQDLLFLALAPHLDPKYETLYGYVNNDVTRKFGTRDLARRLFDKHGAQAVNGALAPGATLFHSGLLVAQAGHGFQASDVFAGYVLAPDASPAPPLRRASCEKRMDTGPAAKTMRAAALLKSGVSLVFPGHRGAGRLRVAQSICDQAGLRLLVLDAAEVKTDAESGATLARAVALQARLEDAALFIRNADVWLDAEDRPPAAAQLFIRALERVALCIGCAPHANWRELMGHRRTIALPFSTLPQVARETEWTRATAAMAIRVEPETIRDLARQFVFTPGEISAAARHAADTLSLETAAAREVLFAAARAQSAHGLGRLAPKISSSYRWSDLVLPQATATQVREVAAAIRNRGLVYEEWRVSPGGGAGGLNVLFSGASGTGKTMSAGIIAAESGLDLYRIDLASVVSKYIGETEKNLDRIFTAARSCNAILFFDEADAMFGKRSEVQDAHDRYANIEVAYLLQKLEDHDGVIILASNLPRNIDEAFSRRIQFHVEFPLPAEPHRERLWRGMFPSEAPVAGDVDFGFLARQFQLTGGQIRTVSVDAAFLAAADGRTITMPLIIKAVARHLVKQGRIPTAHEFREYFPLATGTA